METKDWITLVSVIALIIGWFVNGYLNRKNEIAKKRFEYRMNALQSFLPVWFFIQKNSEPFADSSFLPLLEKSRSEFQLYGTDEEINLFEKFIKGIEQKNLDSANTALHKLVPLIRGNIRKELDI